MKALRGLAACVPFTEEDAKITCLECPYQCGFTAKVSLPTALVEDIRSLLMEQEPRVMTAEEVADCEEGTVLWVEERQGVTWNLFPLEIDVSATHPDTGTNYLFFITYHDIRKFECDEYNRTWRCWTVRPTDEQRKAVKWDD